MFDFLGQHLPVYFEYGTYTRCQSYKFTVHTWKTLRVLGSSPNVRTKFVAGNSSNNWFRKIKYIEDGWYKLCTLFSLQYKKKLWTIHKIQYYTLQFNLAQLILIMKLKKRALRS